MAVLNINLGLKSYEICDTDGNTVGVIRFNPSDPGMVSRWKEVQEFINGFDEKEYNTPEKIGEADRAIKEKFNYAFGTDVSSVLFQNVSSLALCEDGRMVLENVRARWNMRAARKGLPPGNDERLEPPRSRFCVWKRVCHPERFPCGAGRSGGAGRCPAYTAGAAIRMHEDTVSGLAGDI